ncbi:hypothetical protein Droror1_Dr00009583 [Drosera rotundifolia]
MSFAIIDVLKTKSADETQWWTREGELSVDSWSDSRIEARFLAPPSQQPPFTFILRHSHSLERRLNRRSLSLDAAFVIRHRHQCPSPPPLLSLAILIDISLSED